MLIWLIFRKVHVSRKEKNGMLIVLKVIIEFIIRKLQMFAFEADIYKINVMMQLIVF